MNTRIIVWFTYAILFFLLVAAAILIFPMKKQLGADAAELEQQKQIVAQKQKLSNELSTEVHALESSPEAVEKVAREKYNLCKDGEVVMVYDSNK